MYKICGENRRQRHRFLKLDIGRLIMPRGREAKSPPFALLGKGRPGHHRDPDVRSQDLNSMHQLTSIFVHKMVEMKNYESLINSRCVHYMYLITRQELGRWPMTHATSRIASTSRNGRKIGADTYSYTHAMETCVGQIPRRFLAEVRASPFTTAQPPQRSASHKNSPRAIDKAPGSSISWQV